MKKLQLVLVSLSIIALAAGSAFATKQDEINNLLLKPWSLDGLPGMAALADVNETEPNDVCPGEAHTLGDTFHGAIGVGGDQDWISFSLTAGDQLTIGTDADGANPTVDTVIELWDNTCGLMLTSNDDGGPGLYSLILNYLAPYTGTYSLKIRAFGAASTGNYIALGNAVTPAGPGFCPIGTYKGVKRNVNLAIPDNSPATPLVCPPITFNDVPGLVITDVVIDLNIEHTWVGDLIITLQHTSDANVVTTVDLVNRPGVPASGFGCSGDLVSDAENKYYFSSRADLDPLGENDCPAVLPPACYQTAIENGVNDLSIFNGLALGDGTWELLVSDSAGGDVGFVYNWSVHLLAEAPISVEASSWGNIKASYR